MHYVHTSKILPLKLSYIPFSAIPILLKNDGFLSTRTKVFIQQSTI